MEILVGIFVIILIIVIVKAFCCSKEENEKLRRGLTDSQDSLSFYI